MTNKIRLQNRLNNLTCLTCKNMETNKCETCLSITSEEHEKKSQDIEFKNYKNTFLTPEQFYERTGKQWPKENGVYVKVVGELGTWEDIKNADWYVLPYWERDPKYYPMVCALGVKTPPKKWLPKKLPEWMSKVKR